MIRYFLSFSIREQITSLLGFMSAVMLIFSISVILNTWSDFSENKELSNLVEFSVKASNLLHEMQKERGMTAGFIKSRGQKFTLDLPKQRVITDEKKMDFVAYAKTVRAGGETSDFNRSLKNVLKGLTQLAQNRKAVDSLSIKPPKAIGFYTDINTNLLRAVSSTRENSHDASILLQLSSYVNFLMGKERAGIERAIGAGGFSTRFSFQEIKRFNKLITIQKTYFSIFNETALPEHKEFFKSALNNEAVRDVARMRDIARSSVESGDLQGISASDWFKQMTGKINNLKKVEDKLAQDLTSAVIHKKYSALYWLVAISILTLLSFGGVFYFGTNFVSALDTCFSALKTALIKGASGNLGYRIKDIKSQGEMKDVQECTNNFMRQTDLFIKGASSCMDGVAKEDYSKKMSTDALKGDFLTSSKAINAAVVISEQKSNELEGLMNNLEKTVKSVLKDTSELAIDMKKSSQMVLSLSNNSVEKSSDVDQAATVSQEGAVSVASAVEELSASIGQISAQTDQSNKIVSQTQGEVNEVVAVVESFASEVDSIGNVIELINDIAEQTNLLALNATIESARAGEAGKGFAVVASEVKNLAGQTAKATEEIIEKIGAIQQGSEKIVSGIKTIGETMAKVYEISNEITSSVEEQNLATQEISSNMQSTSNNVNEVKDNIGEIKTALKENVSSASDVLMMTDDLANNVEILNAALDNVMKRA